MKCSVVLCSYNGELYIQEQLESILSQSRLPDQIYISDDHSTDNTWELIKSFRARFLDRGIDFRIQRNSERVGVTRNFENLLSCNLHEIVFLSDQDDRWLPHRVSECMSAFDKDENLKCVNSDAAVIDGNGRKTGYTIFDALKVSDAELHLAQSGDFTCVIPNRNLFTGATMAFRREVLDFALPLHPGVIHDDWIGSVAWIVGDVRTLLTPLIEYRLHSRNATGLVNEEAQNQHSTASSRQNDLLAKINRISPIVANFDFRSEKNFPRLEYYSIFLHHLNFRVNIASISRTKRTLKILREFRNGNYSKYSNSLHSAIMDLIL